MSKPYGRARPIVEDIVTHRVLFVVASAEFFLSHRLPLALAAREHGYEVHIATPESEGSKAIARQFPWHRIVLQRPSKNILREIATTPDLIRVYRRVRPDLVHHVAIKAVLYGTAAARFARVPAVVNAVTGLGYAFAEERAKSLLRRFLGAAFKATLRHPRMRFIFQNSEDREVFLQQKWAAREATIIIPGSGVDTTMFSPSPSPAGGLPLVIFASRLLYSKGAREFVEAATEIKRAGITARFAIVGEPDRLSPEGVSPDLYESWRREGVVELWGYRNDMPAIFAQTAIFCLPTYYPEGVPRVLVEAAAAGVASIATDTPGCRDVIRNGESGLLVPPRNPAALAEAIRALILDPAMRARMGARARASVLQNFALEHIVRATMAVYDDLLS